MKQAFKSVLVALCLLLLVLPVWAGGSKEAPKQEVKSIKLVGGTMLPEGHVFWQTIVFFRDKLKEYYKGSLEVDLHHSGSLGTEKDSI